MLSLEWTPEDCMLESELRRAVQHQTLRRVTIIETEEGYYVQVTLNWKKEEQWFLTTRRNRNSPRFCKSLDRLNEHVRTIAPTIAMHLLRI